MLISFKKVLDYTEKTQQYILINTNQIVECKFSITCKQLPRDIPPYIKFVERKHTLYRYIDADGREDIRELSCDIVDTPEGLYGGRYQRNGSEEVFIPKYHILDSDVPTCRLIIYLAGTGGAIEGSSSFCEEFVFQNLDDFLTAIDAIKEYVGIRVVE